MKGATHVKRVLSRENKLLNARLVTTLSPRVALYCSLNELERFTCPIAIVTGLPLSGF